MTDSVLKVCTWNIRGIHHPVKRKKILTYLKKEEVDIALLQETHLKDTEHEKLKREWVGQVFFSSFTSNSRGVCILIIKRLPFKLESCIKDNAGRYVAIKGHLFGENISILNVYAPPGHPPALITKAFSELAELDCALSFAGGDLNCILDPRIDKLPAERTNPTKRARATADVCEELGYLDVWRAFNPNNKEFTFFSGVHKSSSRIDYLFVPKAMLYSVSSCDIGSITISDHAPVYLKFSHGEAQQRSSKWRFNNHLLYDPNFISFFFRTEFQQFFSCNNTPDVSPILWETCKAYSRGLIISYEKKHKTEVSRKATETGATAS